MAKAATSDGAWSGENPLDYALPLLVVQLCLIVGISRLFAFLLKPMRQPRVIAEILGGIFLGASVMGYVGGFTDNIFPASSLIVLNTIANMGLLFFLFMVGLELDMRTLKRTGKPALFIAAAGITGPFGLGVGASFIIKKVMNITSSAAPFIVFMGVAMSITAFPVLARILAERKLLTTDVGSIAMSAAAVNDVVAWVLLALAIALSSSGSNLAIVAWILLCAVAFVLIMYFIVRPILVLLSKKVVEGEAIPEWIVALILMGVLVSGFSTDVIGIHGIFGAFVFGLMVPKDGPMADLIIEKIEDFVFIVLLPLYFASSGLKVNVASISEASSVGILALVIGVACAGKIGGTFLAAFSLKMPVRKCLVLGILMNTKGLVELIVLNIGLQKKVLTSELYTIMVLMAVFTTFMTTPLLMWLYEPAREKMPYTLRTVAASGKADLRMLACVHGMKTIPSMLNLMEVARGERKQPLMTFLLHLVEFSERSSAILMITRVRKDGKPFWNKEAERAGRDQVTVAFQAYSHLSKVSVQTMTAISAFFNMHDDVCTTAEDKRCNLIVLPYHKYMGPDGRLEGNGNPGFQAVNNRVMRAAPCSVAILVDRDLLGRGQQSPGAVSVRIAVLFFGGPDDREALSVSLRMGEHPGTNLHIIRCKPDVAFFPANTSTSEIASATPDRRGTFGGSRRESLPGSKSFIINTDDLIVESEAKLDELALAPVKAAEERRVAAAGAAQPAVPAESSPGIISYEEREVESALSAALQVATEDFNLIIVGRGRRPSPLITQAIMQEHSTRPAGTSSASLHGQVEVAGYGLGPVGEFLAQREEVKASVLVIQQHDPALVRGMTSTAGRPDEGQPHQVELHEDTLPGEREHVADISESDAAASLVERKP
eukprot:TRINITY_DN4301_c0_g1_i1.p1 TRINITY_DN4301_c0_g1~~TRINITY_DN4301_c0_g1_i1.p1  ORF type:complete len:886 (-),score=168.42 TRINITY_DN4301_c0_g1_i1:929-3586(-)